MIDRWRVGADLSTAANGALGVGAVLYILAGNPVWAMLLIVVAIGFDGLDGMLSRRSRTGLRLYGRIADSVADAVTFGVAPAFLLAVHTADPGAWAPWKAAALLVAGGYLAATLARLTYFTALAHDRGHFVGVPSPVAALALVVAVLFHEVPAFQGVAPAGLLVGGALIAAMMVAPVPYPKIRRGALLRWPMAATSALAALALVPIQFRPPPGSLAYGVADGAAFGLLVGVASYYLLGPFTLPRPAPSVG